LGFHECCNDQQCELYIANKLEADVPKKSNKFISKGNGQTISRRFASGKQWFRSNVLLGVTGISFAFEVYNEIKQELYLVRGTVQADILKEDQAQNTCIFY
jgi:methylmalonyl-CoA mutase